LPSLEFYPRNSEFYRLFSLQLPDWKQVKAKLDGMAELLLNY